MRPIAEIRDPLIGTRIDDRYLVQGVLGRGGMGVVYEGVHEQLGRPVAIKVLGAGIAGDPNAVQRFLREAQTASQLTHGNIVDVSDLGQLPDGRPYLVMARIRGMDLCTLLEQKGPQTPLRTAELLRGAAAALDLIHAKGFVHRDVKPENLMHVVREDGSEAVLLLDFGIVGLVSGQAARLTADGSVFGTPAYLPPEVIQGETPNPRADIYSLATVAFELITGVTPYRSDNPLRILPMKVLQDPPRMSAAVGRIFSDQLEQAIAHGLARDPLLRPATAGAFVAAITAAAQQSSGTTQPMIGLDDYAGGRVRTVATAEFELPVGLTESTSFELPLGVTEAAVSAPTDQLSAELGLPTWQGRGPARRRLQLQLGAAVGMITCLFAYLGLRPAETPSVPVPKVELAPAVVTHSDPLEVLPEETRGIAPPSAAASSERATDATPRPAVREPHEAPKPSAKPSPLPPAPKPAPTVKKPALELPVAKPAPAAAVGPSAAELIQQAQRELIQGHLQSAADLYAQASRRDPNSEAAFRGLGLASERLGRTAEAVRALKRALALAPNGANAGSVRARLDKLTAAP